MPRFASYWLRPCLDTCTTQYCHLPSEANIARHFHFRSSLRSIAVNNRPRRIAVEKEKKVYIYT